MNTTFPETNYVKNEQELCIKIAELHAKNYGNNVIGNVGIRVSDEANRIVEQGDK